MGSITTFSDYIARTSVKRTEARNEHLRYTVKYTYDPLPFYRELVETNDLSPGDFRTTSDLEELPVVTGTDVREGLVPETDTPSLRTGRGRLYRPVGTSGFDDRPTHFYKSHDEIDL